MQSHVDIKRPTIDDYSKALDAFMATGLEVQITELDFTINFDTDGSSPSYNYKNEGETIDEQAEFVGDFMTMVTKKQINRNKNVSPKGITGVTLWVFMMVDLGEKKVSRFCLVNRLTTQNRLSKLFCRQV